MTILAQAVSAHVRLWCNLIALTGAVALLLSIPSPAVPFMFVNKEMAALVLRPMADGEADALPVVPWVPVNVPVNTGQKKEAGKRKIAEVTTPDLVKKISDGVGLQEQKVHKVLSGLRQIVFKEIAYGAEKVKINGVCDIEVKVSETAKRAKVSTKVSAKLCPSLLCASPLPFFKRRGAIPMTDAQQASSPHRDAADK